MYQHVIVYYMRMAWLANKSGAWKLAWHYEYDAMCLMCLQDHPIEPKER